MSATREEQLKKAQEAGKQHREAVKQATEWLGHWAKVGGQYTKSLIKG